MTGEINLRGSVLPIGGLKEKALGAVQAGIKTILVPRLNLKDVPDIPESARKNSRNPADELRRRSSRGGIAERLTTESRHPDIAS